MKSLRIMKSEVESRRKDRFEKSSPTKLQGRRKNFQYLEKENNSKKLEVVANIRLDSRIYQVTQ